MILNECQIGNALKDTFIRLSPRAILLTLRRTRAEMTPEKEVHSRVRRAGSRYSSFTQDEHQRIESEVEVSSETAAALARSQATDGATTGI